MKRVYITCVGKLKEKFFADAVAEYLKRLDRFCDVVINECDDHASPDAVKRECDAIERTFRDGEFRVLCDIGGDLVTSEQLSELIGNAFASAKSSVRFIIGGSRGVDERIRRAADRRISFGRATYPHQLMRVILAEQIYRAFTIESGMPYHK